MDQRADHPPVRGFNVTHPSAVALLADRWIIAVESWTASD